MSDGNSTLEQIISEARKWHVRYIFLLNFRRKSFCIICNTYNGDANIQEYRIQTVTVLYT